VALGLTAALDRLAVVVEGCDSTAGWERSEQRITTLLDDLKGSSGLDHKYWLGGRAARHQPEAIAGSHLTMAYDVTIELARYWGGGDALDRDYFGLLKSAEAEANIVEQSIQLLSNWARATTGIVLVNQPEPAQVVSPSDEKPILLWVIALRVMIRQPKVAVTV
jgi:hypothetical protein